MPATNLKSSTTRPVPLVMQHIDGTYTLKFRDTDGRLKSIKHVGDSVAPFEVYQPFFGDYIAIRKFTRSVYSKFYLVNPRTGQIAKESINGIESIKIDKKLGRFLVRVFYSNEKSSMTYKTVSMFAGTDTINGYWIDDLTDITKYPQIELETTGLDFSISDEKPATQNSKPIITRRQREAHATEKMEQVVQNPQSQKEADPVVIKKPRGRPRKNPDPALVVEKRPRGRPKKNPDSVIVAEKRPRGRPPKIKTDTVVLKRPRGRPKGSTNKPKTAIPVLVQDTPQPTQVQTNKENRWEKPKPKINAINTASAVKIKQTKRVLGGIYSDIFINDRKVLAKQLNVAPELMLNDRVLALSVDMESKNDQEIKLFFANGAQWETKHKDRLTGNSIRIAGVAEYENQLKIALFNGATSWISERDAGLQTTKKFDKIEIQEIKSLPDRPMKKSKSNKPKSTVRTNPQRDTIEHKPVTNTSTAPQGIKKKGIRLVRTELVPFGQNKTAYNVYINDVPVVRQHSSVSVKTFCDGALLGIRGIDLQNVLGPGTVEWKLFLTDKTRWIPKLDSGTMLYITDISETANALKLKLSNSRVITLFYDSIISAKNPKKYQIQR